MSSSIQSPGGATPGSVTPRGAAGSQSRRARFVGDYYDQTIDYTADRHFRSYDEYSQGSAASHDEGMTYEHEYTLVHDSPTHLDVLDTRSMQSIVVDPVSNQKRILNSYFTLFTSFDIFLLLLLYRISNILTNSFM